MQEKTSASRTVKIPDGIEVGQDGNTVAVKGQKGELKREFRHFSVKLEKAGSEIKITSDGRGRKECAVIGTWEAHLKNMFTGVQKGYEAKMKMVYSHFPPKMSVDGKKFVVSNFLGEKRARAVEIEGNVKIDVKKDEITITGANKEEVGQAAASIEQMTKITRYDRRVFQDGCYLTQPARPSEK
jgi:large subunit ribosomal protein L6